MNDLLWFGPMYLMALSIVFPICHNWFCKTDRMKLLMKILWLIWFVVCILLSGTGFLLSISE